MASRHYKQFDYGIKRFPDNIQDLESPATHAFEPLITKISVGWGDCDPAQIAYTARIPEWALKSIEDWYSHCLHSNWYGTTLQLGIGMPFVSLGCDFLVPVTPEHPLEVAVFVSRIGNTSLSHWVDGFQNERLCFTAKTTAVFVHASTMAPISIPDNMRRNIENYMVHQNRQFDCP